MQVNVARPGSCSPCELKPLRLLLRYRAPKVPACKYRVVPQFISALGEFEPLPAAAFECIGYRGWKRVVDRYKYACLAFVFPGAGPEVVLVHTPAQVYAIRYRVVPHIECHLGADLKAV